MSLQAVYQSFLHDPNATVLADDASLNYITTLTTIKGAAPIVKHVISQGKILEKKQENVLNTVEGGGAISMEVETTIEFITGGGPYLPDLDDNFLADRVVTIPIVSSRLTHITEVSLTKLDPYSALHSRQDPTNSPVLGSGLAT